MLDIRILTIPHDKQRYNTVGDYYLKGGTLYIYISSMNDFRKEGTVAIHELSEALLCQYKGISLKEIDDFDMEYEKLRAEDDISEPGDSPLAPYHKQHFIATTIERLLVTEFDLTWSEYEETINAL